MVGIQSHGQGLETALSQIACEELGIDPARISVRHGDTESTAFGFGTFASRSMVMSGGAVARASRILRDKLCRIGAHLLQCDLGRGALRRRRGAWAAGLGDDRRDRQRRASADARIAARRRAAARRDRDLRAGRSAPASISYATHGAVVAVDPETGAVELLDFAVAEDCGTMVNPMLVEGQIRGGVVQGIGTALLRGDPLRRAGPAARRHACSTTTCPARTSCRRSGSATCTHPATATEYGMKGMGEGGAVAPPAAIANAVRDALAPLGVEINETPLTAAAGAGGDQTGASLTLCSQAVSRPLLGRSTGIPSRIARSTPCRSRSGAPATAAAARSSASPISWCASSRANSLARCWSAGTLSVRRPIGSSCFRPIKAGGISMTN